MSFIKEFTITGLAGRDDVVHHELDRFQNVLWGTNGCGKTSLLRILHSALKGDSSPLEDVYFRTAEVIFYSEDNEVDIKRTISMEAFRDKQKSDIRSKLLPLGMSDTEKGRSGQGEVPAWATTVLAREDQSLRTLGFQGILLPITRLTQQELNPAVQGFLEVSSSNSSKESNLEKLFANEVNLKWQRFYLTTLREIQGIQQQGLTSILVTLFGGAVGDTPSNSVPQPPDTAYELVTNFLAGQNIELKISQNEFISRYTDQSALQRVVEQIQEATRDVEKVLRPQHAFQEVVQGMFSRNKSFSIGEYPNSLGSYPTVEVKGVKIPLESLSSGEKQLLNLMLETLSGGRSSIMIDEPELSMHPDWQQRLVGSMREINPDCQLILATHSPSIMAEVSDEYVFEL